jgi:ABC-type polysaccharide/polyol phosphate export permease
MWFPTHLSYRQKSLLGIRLRLFHDLWSRRETVWYLVVSNLKAGHRDKVLGHLWNLLDPLMFVGVYFVVFGLIFGQGGAGRNTEFTLYLALGVLAFRFVDGTLAQSTLCIRGNRGLIHEINFPKAIFPVSICLSRFYDLLWAMLVLIPILLLTGHIPTIHILWTVPLLAIQLVLVCGMALVTAHWGAFFADMHNVVNVATRLLMYISPTFYYVRGPKALISQKYLGIYMLNPLACLFESYRDAMIWGRMPEPRMMLYAGAVSLMTLIVGSAVFSSGEGKFAKYI